MGLSGLEFFRGSGVRVQGWGALEFGVVRTHEFSEGWEQRMGFQGLGFRGLGFGVSGFRVWGLGLRV